MGRHGRHGRASPGLQQALTEMTNEPSNRGLLTLPVLWLHQMIQQLDPASRLSLFRCCTGLAESVVQHAPNTLLKLNSWKIAAQARRQFNMQLAAKASNLHLWLTTAGGNLATLYNAGCWGQVKQLTLDGMAVNSTQYQHLHAEQLLNLVRLQLIVTDSTGYRVARALPVEKLRHSMACGHLPLLTSLHVIGACSTSGAEDVRKLGEAVGHQIQELVVEAWVVVSAMSTFTALTSIRVLSSDEWVADEWQLLRMLTEHPKLRHVLMPSWPFTPNPGGRLSCSWQSLHITHRIPLDTMYTVPDGLQSLRLSGELRLANQAASQRSLQVLSQLPEVIWSSYAYRTRQDWAKEWLEWKRFHMAAGPRSFAIKYYSVELDLQVLQACLPHLDGTLWLNQSNLTAELLQALTMYLPDSVRTLGLCECYVKPWCEHMWVAAWQLLPRHINHLVLYTYSPGAILLGSIGQLPLHVTKLTIITPTYAKLSGSSKADVFKEAAELRPDLQIRSLAIGE